MIRKQKGFTLIELLVVIAIIIILAAILFPVFAKARAKAIQTTCASHMKQLGTACAMYESDNDEYMPPVGNPFAYGHLWPDILKPYVKMAVENLSATNANLAEIYKCPAAPEEEATGNINKYRSYGMNRWAGLGPNSLVPMAKAKYPASTLRITECWSEIGGAFYAPMPNMPSAGMTQYYAPGWHGERNNVLWMDGHVSNMKATYMSDLADVNNGISSDRNNIMYADSGPCYGQAWARLDGPKP
jgi:prepilin-type N-terminal cleavage/methylation domain-containing protein/prepilin-type processing-associated H-X9-DG protein